MRKEAIRNESRFASPASSNISSSGFLFCCVILRSLTLAVPLRSLPVPAPSPSLAQNLGWSPPCPHHCCSHQCSCKHCLPGNPWAGSLSANPAILAQPSPDPSTLGGESREPFGRAFRRATCAAQRCQHYDRPSGQLAVLGGKEAVLPAAGLLVP